MTLNLPSLEVPYSHVAITASTDQSIIPGNHGPDTHNMSLQGALRVSLSIEHMNLGIIKCHNDVLGCQMQACNDAPLLGNIPRCASTARSPSSFN